MNRRQLWFAACLTLALVSPFLVFLALASESSSAQLPDTGWTPLLRVFFRSIAMASAAGLVATTGGVCLAVGMLVLRRIWWLVALAGWTLATPAVVVALPLQAVVGADPWWLSVTVYGVTGAPIAAALIAAAAARMSASELLAAVDLGIGTARLWRRIVIPAAWPGICLGWMASTMLALTDPSISLAMTGSQPQLASYLYHAVTTDAPAIVAARGVLLIVAVTLLMVLVSAPWLPRLGIPTLWRSAALRRHLDPWGIGRLLALLMGSVQAALFVAVAVQAVQWQPRGNQLSATIASSAAVAVVVVASSLLCGGITATLTRGSSQLVDALMLSLALLSPVALGVVIAVVHRNVLRLGPLAVPSFVGGDSLTSGMAAVLLCFLLLGIPLAHLMIGAGLRRTRDITDAATLLGAGLLRSAVTVLFPALRRQVGMAVAALTSIVLTRVTPIVFVQPPEITLAAPRSVTLVDAGLSQEAATLSLACAVVAAAPLLITVDFRRKKP